MKQIVALAMIASLLFTGCRKEEEDSETEYQISKRLAEGLKTLNFDDTEMLLVELDAEEDTLMQIGYDGVISKLKAENATGEDFYEYNFLSETHDINEDYFIMRIEQTSGELNRIVEKRSGKLIPSIIIPDFFYGFNDDINYKIYPVIDGKFYCKNENYQLAYQTLTDNPEQRIVSYKEDKVYDFAVDKLGNVVYSGKLGNNYVVRCSSADGSTINAYSSSNYSVMPFYCADGTIHYDLGNSSDNKFGKISFAPMRMDSIDVSTDYPQSIDHVLNFADNTIVFDSYGITHLDRNGNVTHTLSDKDMDMSEIIDLNRTKTHYYIAYEDNQNKVRLCKIDPATAAIEVLVEGKYEVNSFGVTEAGTVYFKALDTERYVSVIAKIDASRQITILKDDYAGNVKFIPVK